MAESARACAGGGDGHSGQVGLLRDEDGVLARHGGRDEDDVGGRLGEQHHLLLLLLR